MFKVVECDVLVIGGGIGGPVAALAAREEGAEVVLVDKSAVRRSGGGVSGEDHLTVGPHDNIPPEDFISDQWDFTDGLLDMDLMEVFCRDTMKGVEILGEIGLPVRNSKTGEFVWVLGMKGKKPYMLSLEGSDIKPLFDKTVRKKGVKVHQFIMALSLLKPHGRVTGMVGWNTRTGEFVVFKSKTTVLATGHVVRLFYPQGGDLFNTWHSPYNTGDGHVMAYDAGAELVNMEIGTCNVVPKGYTTPGVTGFRGAGAVLINALGEEFLHQYEADGRHFRWRVCGAVLSEIREGRGPIFWRCSHLAPDKIELIRQGFINEKPTLFQYMHRLKVDFAKDEFEVAVCEPILTSGKSGLVVDRDCWTRVPGLYAAGDCTGGMSEVHAHGAVVFGHVSGKGAARDAVSSPDPILDRGEAEAHIIEVKKHLDYSDGLDWPVFNLKLARMMSDYAFYPRSERGLQRALRHIEVFIEDTKRLRATDPHELMRVQEVKNLVRCAEMVCWAALTRKDSRMGPSHFRADFPERDDDNWHKWILLSKDPSNGEMRINTRSIRRPAFIEAAHSGR